MTKCPLCSDCNSKKYTEVKSITYFKCLSCDLIFQDRNSLLTDELERERYLKHENTELTEGYRRFLENLTTPLLSKVDKGSVGLDFGSGPFPMMGQILADEELTLDEYDPYFSPIDLDGKQYDFIIMCEVVEHINNLNYEFKRLNSLLVEEGLLFIQTSLYNEKIDFDNWYYKNDSTHISFLTGKTLEFICQNFNFSHLEISGNVIILSKARN